jgi:hypothetical protein
MKLQRIATLIVSGLLIMFAVVFVFGVSHPISGPERYPGGVRAANERVNLADLHRDYFTSAGTYYTDAKLRPVWRWYATRYDVVPEEGIGAQDHCVTLSRARRFAIVEHTSAVMLCSVPHGTLASVNHVVYLWP